MPRSAPARVPPGRVFLAFLALGLTSFGGPVAHIGYFREAFVARRGWLDERGYAELVALCQMLPGPTSSQVGVGIGLTKAGYPGALAAWLGFTAPSAALMIGLGYGVLALGEAVPAGLLAGLKAVVVAVVALAVWGMARTLCPDPPRVTIAAVGAAVALGVGGPAGQVGVILGGALAGLLLLRG
ncbi:MAG: chromate transporter, partial [Defluviicoccus sp.]|nr:chromate transporter [Defluviicoccus sp.]